MGKPSNLLIKLSRQLFSDANEQMIDWLLDKLPQFESTEVPQLREYRSHLSDQFCYRIFPQDRLGAGAFTALLRNTQPEEM
ncbi:hypothetical protein H6F51_11730 [Cyanobacteria bacterium FACHB-DQ100]|nr:hypothetical protein [Cyanobacteria bacterium FACHB-DQ100]